MLNHLHQQWKTNFGSEEPEVIVRSPGRVNIIGEHTDYNHGWVMPGAMDLSLYIMIGRPSTSDNESLHHWVAADLDEKILFEMDGELPDTRTIWPKYIHGAIQYFGKKPGPLQILIGGNLPIGAGVSSSSALVGGLLVALQQLTYDERSRKEIAELSNRVEREVIGLRGGIMDQFAILLSQKDKVMMLDCREKTFEFIPADLPGARWILLNTKVKHQLIDSDYNQRESQCRQAVELIRQIAPQVNSLRDVNEDVLNQSHLPEVLYRRSLFVIRENDRVHQMKIALASKDVSKAGRLLKESHFGLQHQYEVSCAELDLLAEIANSTEGVYGGRMMGGGFGGCVICLVQEEALESFVEKAGRSYLEKFGIEMEVIAFSLSNGAEVINL